jgi:hypothetical protein
MAGRGASRGARKSTAIRAFVTLHLLVFFGFEGKITDNGFQPFQEKTFHDLGSLRSYTPDISAPGDFTRAKAINGS